MKKALAMLLALVMVLSLAACGNNADGDTSKAPETNSAAPSDESKAINIGKTRSAGEKPSHLACANTA